MYKKGYKIGLKAVLLFAAVFFTLNNILYDHISESTLEANALSLNKHSNFNPRSITYAVYSFINCFNGGSPQECVWDVGNAMGEVYFHWDDWVDMYPADAIISNFREKYPDGSCDARILSFARVNGFMMETFSRKVSRGMVNLYCIKDVPQRLIVMTDYSMVEVPVTEKKRVGRSQLPKAVEKEQLIRESTEIEITANQKYVKRPLKSMQKDVYVDSEDFVFNPEYEIFKLKNRLLLEDLSDSEHKYLRFLEYSNRLVEISDTYFKYPWIVTDIILQHSHHLAYPFFKRYVSNRERQSIVHHMIRTWFEFAESIGIASWLNYGSLLGWSFNGVNMPWDTDVDIQLPIVQLDRLAREYNLSLILENPRYGNGKYLLEISPTYVRQGNGKNFIDARFIEINSGLYIDISALSHTSFIPPNDVFDGLNDHDKLRAMPIHCKNWNWHTIDEILPLRHTYFEGGGAYIPHNVSRILKRKYGKDSFTNKLKYGHYNYQRDIELWVPDEICTTAPSTNRFSTIDKTSLSLKGACNSELLQDEFNIVRECADRHNNLELIDKSFDYSIEKTGDLPIFRKDAWDYYNDINEHSVNHERWYVRENVIK